MMRPVVLQVLLLLWMGSVQAVADLEDSMLHPHPSMEWIVSATVPMIIPKDRNPLAPDRTKQPPYIHWTCHEKKVTTTTTTTTTTNDGASPQAELHHHTPKKVQMLQCCQAIYDAIMQRPGHLRWGMKVSKDFVQQDKASVLSSCTKSLLEVPLARIVGDDTTPSATVARYTLLQIPEGYNINVRFWEQAVGWKESSGTTTVRFFHEDIPAPIQLNPKAAMMWNSQSTNDDDNDDANKNPPAKQPSWRCGANVTSKFLVTDPDDEEERYLKHQLNVTIRGPMSEGGRFKVVLFLPTGTALSKREEQQQQQRSCRLLSHTCGDHFDLPSSDPTVTCLVGYDATTSTTTAAHNHKKPPMTSFDQNDMLLMWINFTVPTITNTPMEPCSLIFTWTNQIVLEDDDGYLLPMPFVMDGIVDDSIPWDQRTTMMDPLWTNPLDDAYLVKRDEL